MKFSKTIKRLSEIDPVFGPHYIQFKLLKKYLKEITGKADSQNQATFVQLVENEHQRVKKLIEYKVAELQLQCSSIVTNIRIMDSKIDTNPEDIKAQLRQLTTHADHMADILAATERFVHYNKEGFRKIIKKHDKMTRISLSWLEAQKLRTFFVHAESDLERLLVELSDIYKYVQENTDQAGPGEHKVSDDTFERKSYKYWVAFEDVFQFKTKMIKHLPLHIFARKTDEKFQRRKTVVDLLSQVDEDEDKTEYSKLGWISSVYFDNDEMDCYRTRVNFYEGATLFRVRWYGDPKDVHRTDVMSLPRAPKKGCYYERKTHHESWVQATSVKERFPIPEPEILSFMKGEVTPEDVVKDDKLLGLAGEMQEEIIGRKLHPIIRTVYKRAAFQHETTNDVRITLDTNLTFVNERWSEVEEGCWKRDEEEVEAEGDWRVFPYAVLEVKLKAGEPQWLQEILNEPYIRKVHKFSKFQQASATYYPHKIHQFPYWFTEEDANEAKARAITDAKKRAEEGQEDALSNGDSGAEVSSNNQEGIENLGFEKDKAGTTATSPSEITPYIVSDEIKVFKAPELRAQESVAMEMSTRKTTRRRSSVNKWKKSKKGSKATEKQAAFGGIPGKEGKDKNKFATARIKIEPKTFFANERTFLQWLRSGLSLFSLGGLLYSLSGTQAAQISGLIFSACAILICIYGLAFFYWRMHMIKNRRNQRYDDYFGPAFLAVLMIGGLVAQIVLERTMGDTPATGSIFSLFGGGRTQSSALETCDTSRVISGLPPFTSAHGLARADNDHLWTCAGDNLILIQEKTGNSVEYVPLGGAVECKAVTKVSDQLLSVVVQNSVPADGFRKQELLLLSLEDKMIKDHVDLSTLPDFEVTGVAYYPRLFRNYTTPELLLPGTLFISNSISTTALVLTTSQGSSPTPITSFSIPEGADSITVTDGNLLLVGESSIIRYQLDTGVKLPTFMLAPVGGRLAGVIGGEGRLLGLTSSTGSLVELDINAAERMIACAA